MKFECFKCGKKIQANEAGLGMNVGFGPQYWCRECEPPKSAEEIIRSIDGVIRSPVEPGKEKERS